MEQRTLDGFANQSEQKKRKKTRSHKKKHKTAAESQDRDTSLNSRAAATAAGSTSQSSSKASQQTRTTASPAKKAKGKTKATPDVREPGLQDQHRGMALSDSSDEHFRLKSPVYAKQSDQSTGSSTSQSSQQQQQQRLSSLYASGPSASGPSTLPPKPTTKSHKRKLDSSDVEPISSSLPPSTSQLAVPTTTTSSASKRSRAGLTSPMKRLRTDDNGNSRRQPTHKEPTASPLNKNQAAALDLSSSDDSDAPLVPTHTSTPASSSFQRSPAKSNPTGKTAPAPTLASNKAPANQQRSPQTRPVDPKFDEDEVSSSDIEVSQPASTKSKELLPQSSGSPRTSAAVKGDRTNSADLPAMFSDEHDEAQPVPNGKGKGTIQPAAADHLADMVSSDDDADLQPVPRQKAQIKSRASQAEDHNAPMGLVAGSSSAASEDQSPQKTSQVKSTASGPATSHPTSSPQVRSSKPSQTITIVSSDNEEEEAPIPPSRSTKMANHKGKSKARAMQLSETSDGDDDDEDRLPSPDAIVREPHLSSHAATGSSSKKKHQRMEQKRRHRTPSSEESNSEDEDDLSMDFDTLQDSRLRTPKTKPDRMAVLRAARERKKEREEERHVRQTQTKNRAVVLDSDEEAERAKQDKKRRKKERKAAKAREREAQRQAQREVMDLDEDGNSDGASESDDSIGFIVADDEDALGAEEVRQMMPVQFTASAFQSEQWHHRQFIILMVQKRLLPDEPVSEDLRHSAERCKRLVTDLTGSLVRSQVWTKKFTDALKLPNLTQHRLSETLEGCEACHLGGRKSRFGVTLFGKVYDEDPPYRPLAVNKRGQPEDTDDDSTRAWKQKEFAIGSECLKRAETYHSLTHFQWSLWRQVCAIVEAKEAQSSDVEEGTTRKEWVVRQRHLIEEVTEHMQKNNFFKSEWKELHELVEFAKREYAR